MARNKAVTQGNPGFTLVEILVALVVVSTGVTIFVSLFSSSLDLSQAARNQTVAASLAEEQILALTDMPERFDWHENAWEPGQLMEIGLRGEDYKDARRFDRPAALPAIPRAARSEENFYRKFLWRAYARLPKAEAKYVEVTVAVHWEEKARPKIMTLTTCIPRSVIVEEIVP